MNAYNPCIIIPVYNHGEFIENTFEKIYPYGYPVFIIDDGSKPECWQALERLGARYSDIIHLLRLETNQGKGAAVMAGFRAAFAQGFTHALQIDADGQHDIADIDTFINRSRLNPEEIVSGRPIYDDSVPKSRLYGRYITHVWVWIETLSLDIKDSMCGFRLYPLKPTIGVINKAKIAKRMAFDIEIIVRLYWAGVPVHFIATRVIYPQNGVSHFDVLKDNIGITKTHTILFLGMVKRLPRLLFRKWASK